MREGLGFGKGQGYYNLIPLDSHIHSLSAKGIKTKPTVVYNMAGNLVKELKPLTSRIEVAGSIRRKDKRPNDIDIVLIPKDKAQITEKILSLADSVRAKGEKEVFITKRGVNIDFYFATPDDFGAQLLSRTGSSGYAIGLRIRARKKGLRLNQYGLWDDGHRLAGKTEQSIGDVLGKKIRIPELR